MKRIILFTAALTCAATTKAQVTTDTLKQQQLDEVVVAGVRVQKNAPYAVANLKESELEAFSKGGRELPFLLSQTPGVLAWGENGLGTGTSAMRIRGAAGSRINITLDGVALNSPDQPDGILGKHEFLCRTHGKRADTAGYRHIDQRRRCFRRFGITGNPCTEQEAQRGSERFVWFLQHL